MSSDQSETGDQHSADSAMGGGNEVDTNDDTSEDNSNTQSDATFDSQSAGGSYQPVTNGGLATSSMSESNGSDFTTDTSTDDATDDAQGSASAAFSTQAASSGSSDDSTDDLSDVASGNSDSQNYAMEVVTDPTTGVQGRNKGVRNLY